MVSVIFTSIKNLLEYIVDIRLFDIPTIMICLVALFAFSYIVGMILVGFPCVLWRAIRKKENSRSEAEEKVTFIVSACVAVVSLLMLFAD